MNNCGVIRAVLAGGDEDPEYTGTLWVPIPDGVEIDVPVVIYTLDQHRLVGMLEAARGGESDEAILLALDAAALTEPPDDWNDDD